jgi:hypothetical protein
MTWICPKRGTPWANPRLLSGEDFITGLGEWIYRTTSSGAPLLRGALPDAPDVLLVVRPCWELVPNG